MHNYLPIIAFLLGLIAVLISKSKADLKQELGQGQITARFLPFYAAALVGLPLMWLANHNQMATGSVLYAGLFLVPLALLIPSKIPATATAFFVGAFVVMVTAQAGQPNLSELAVGVGMAGIIAFGARASMPPMIALVAASTVLANQLGVKIGMNGGIIGSAILVAGAVAALVAVTLDRFGPAVLKKFRSPLICVIMIVLCYLIARRWLWSTESGIVMALAITAAFIVNWLLPEDEESGNLRMGIATIIWCSIATVAFGLQRAVGIGEAVAAAGLCLVALGNRRAMQSVIPLLAIGFYREFRETYPNSEHAVDIGTHYAVIGTTIGAVAAILPLEWIQQHKWPEGRKALVGLTLWALVLPIVPCLVALMLGEKGVTGFLLGLGISALLAGFRSERGLGVLATVAALGGSVIVTYGHLGKLLDITRNEKVHYFAWSAAGILAIGLVLWWLGQSKAKEQAS